MKKVSLKKIIAATALALSLVTPSLVSAADQCGKWYIESVSKPVCLDKRCGLLGWYPTTLQQTVTEAKKCINSNNSTITRTRETHKTLDCDC